MAPQTPPIDRASEIEKEVYDVEDELKKLLDPRERELMDVVTEMVKEECADIAKKNPRHCSENDHELMLTHMKDIGKIMKSVYEKLKNNDEHKSLFLYNFEKWKSSREITIKELKEIAELINSERFDCNVVRLVGSSTGIAGGLIAAGLYIAAPFTAGVTLPGAIAGTVVAVAGGGTTLGTAITERVLLKKRINAAQDILKSDEEHLKGIKEWVLRTAELAKAIEDFIGLDLTKELVEDFKYTLQKILQHEKGIGATTLMLKITVSTVISKLMSQLGIFSTMTANHICALVTFVIHMIMVFAYWEKRNPLVFESISLAAKSVSYAITVGLSIGESTGIVTKLFSSSGAIARGVTQAVAQGVLASVGVALDITNLVLTSIDVHRGSVSEHAASITSIVTQLEQEMKRTEILYSAMKRMESRQNSSNNSKNENFYRIV